VSSIHRYTRLKLLLIDVWSEEWDNILSVNEVADLNASIEVGCV